MSVRLPRRSKKRLPARHKPRGGPCNRDSGCCCMNTRLTIQTYRCRVPVKAAILAFRGPVAPPDAEAARAAVPASQHLARVLHSSRPRGPAHRTNFIKPYLKGQKNDFNDAAAIAEAVDRPSMRFVAPRSTEQLDLQAIHRVRSRLVSERTASSGGPGSSDRFLSSISGTIC